MPPGDYSFTLHVDDGAHESADDVLVTLLGRPTLSISGDSVAEGDLGLQPATFRVTLSRASTEAVAVYAITLPETASSPGR